MNPHKIRWTEETWNPTKGCSKVTRACMHCYAETMAGRIVQMKTTGADHYEGTVKKMGDAWRWTGKVVFQYLWLTKPLRNKKPTVYFVNSMSDLFHEELSVEQIAAVFATMMECRNRHIFQVLTKRPKRMQELLSSSEFIKEVCRQSRKLASNGYIKTAFPMEVVRELFPLDNVWLGTSVGEENDKHFIDYLRDTPAEVRFLSLEPLVGRIHPLFLDDIHWVILGGESGWARTVQPLHPDYAEEIRNACLQQGVPFFFKQWGRWMPWKVLPDGTFINVNGVAHNNPLPDNLELAVANGQWNDGMEFTNKGCTDYVFQSTSKDKSGNLLDGKVYEAFPQQLYDWTKKHGL